MLTNRILKVAGMGVMAVALGLPPAHAAIDLTTGRGALTYAKETITTTVTGSDGVTYHVLSHPTGARLSFTAPVVVAIAAGGTAQFRFNLTDMVFAGGTAPSLAIAGVSDATSTVVQGGAAGDPVVRFTTVLGATALTGSEVMTLTVRGIGVLVGQQGEVRVHRREGLAGSFPGSEPVAGFKVESGLRETVAPASPVVKIAEGFRTFSGGGSVASVGRISFGPPPGTGQDRVFIASTSAPASLTNMLSSTASDSTITFSGDLGFVADAFLSAEADCSSKDEEGVLDGAGRWAAVNLVDANDRHLCIEVDGVTSIPETQAYEATVAYGGISGATFPPGGTTLQLGKVVREGTIVDFPYVNTHPNVNFRFLLSNRGGEPAPYRMEFVPPEATFAEPLDEAEGTLAPNSALLIRAVAVVRMSGRRLYTAVRLAVGAPRENLTIVTIQTNRSDGSTDTVRY